MKISPVIISKNASRTIIKTLDSLSCFDEVVVLDTGSTDNTIKIAQSYPNVKVYNSNFSGFGKSKNEAARLAKNDWIISIDTDEVLTSELLDSIRNLEPEMGNVYRWKRCNYYCNRQIKHSGWGNEQIVRLYNRKSTAFKEKLVHEYIETNDHQIKTLKGNMNHFSYHSISDFSRKREFYSDLFSEENKGKKKSSASKAIFHSIYEFFNTYFLKKGFLDGYLGLLIAVSNANVTFLKYIKLYEANLIYSSQFEKPVSLIKAQYPTLFKGKQVQSLELLHAISGNNPKYVEKKRKSLKFLHNDN